MKRTRSQQFSPSAKIACLLLQSDWQGNWQGDGLLEVLSRSVSTVWKELPSGSQFLESLVKRFPERPPLTPLVDFLENSPEFQLAVSKRRVRQQLKRVWLPYPSLNWLDWALPRLDSVAQLASHCGTTPKKIDWLTAGFGPLERRPLHYVSRWIKKRRIGHRLIESPKSQLKQIQRILLQDLLNAVPRHAAATGFCPGRSVHDFVMPHCSQQVCIRVDLQDFFPAIRSARVQGLFRACGYSQDVARCLANLTTTRTPPAILDQQQSPNRRGATRQSQLYLPRHLPQGAPTSPAIANLIAYRLDCRLAGLASATHARYTRYADDLLFSGDREFARGAKRFVETVGAIAIEEGWKVNFRKTRVAYPSQRQLAAGMVINQRMNVPREVFDNLKATLFNCVQQGVASQNHDQLADFRAHLLGRIGWVRQANASRGMKLMRLFEQISWEGES